MPAFCAGYFAGDILFEIDGVKGAPSRVPSYVANSFAILTRGAPTRPSPLLLDLILGGPQKPRHEWDRLAREPLHLIGDREPSWKFTVLGNSEGYNPALEFLESVLPADLPDIAFIQKLLVPEYPLFNRLQAPRRLTDGPNAERVDFYLPQADLVIEIDGSQHLGAGQTAMDKERDRFLARFGIVTLRLTTQDLVARNAGFEAFCGRLRASCDASPLLGRYREAAHARRHAGASLRFDMTAAIRLQVAIMIAISHGQLDPAADEWRLNVTQDFFSSVGLDWAEIALQELLDWFGLFSRLSHTKYQSPRVVFDPDGLCIDMRLFERPDDRSLPPNAIVVRTSAVQQLPFVAQHVTRVQELGVSWLAAYDDPDYAAQPPAASDLTELCFRVFGHESFRPGQETLILNALSGQKSLGLMPTGGGKSLCFQVPALLKAGTTLTVVPIKALGRDHCAELEAAGFTGRVVNIDSDMPAALRDGVYAARIRQGAMRFVFVSPERFQVAQFRDLVSNLDDHGQLRMFVIDEVHCMSEWGHDFRPSYLTLPGTLRNLAMKAPVLGLTATASVNVLRDIQGEFDISDELVAYEMHRSRTELNFSIRKELSSPPQIAKEVSRIATDTEGNLPPPTHVFARYANGVMGVEAYATALSRLGIGLRVGSFSGRTPKTFEADQAFARLQAPDIPLPTTYEAYKQSVQELWKQGRLDVIVTTKAFGMGVNKSDVRHTLHAGMPSSMEAFYQEAGRAGRDRQASTCHMLLRPEPDDASALYEQLRRNLTPQAINHALEKDISGRRLAKNAGGDFRAQLWFLSQGLIEVDQENELVLRLIRILHAARERTILIRARDLEGLAQGPERLQLTLYRLYQMGLIEPWTVTDWGRQGGDDSHVQAAMVTIIPRSFADACTIVATRIRAIDGHAADISGLDQLQALPMEAEDWPALSRLLLDWVRRKHLDSRLQSTWNLYAKSLAFKEENAAAFREELEAFFKVDSAAFELAALRDMPLEDVVPALRQLISAASGEGLKEIGALRKLSAQLARLLEGTQDSPGLNLAAAMLSLLVDEKPAPEAKMRFKASGAGDILAFWRGPGRDLVGRVASASPVALEVIGSWLVGASPDRETLIDIHDMIPAQDVSRALFEKLAAELAETV